MWGQLVSWLVEPHVGREAPEVPQKVPPLSLGSKSGDTERRADVKVGYYLKF